VAASLPVVAVGAEVDVWLDALVEDVVDVDDATTFTLLTEDAADWPIL
jgi:hypothetical protein